MDGDITYKILTISEFCISNPWYKALYPVSGLFLKAEFFLELRAGSWMIELKEGNKYVVML